MGTKLDEAAKQRRVAAEIRRLAATTQGGRTTPNFHRQIYHMRLNPLDPCELPRLVIDLGPDCMETPEVIVNTLNWLDRAICEHALHLQAAAARLHREALDEAIEDAAEEARAVLRRLGELPAEPKDTDAGEGP